MDLEPYSAFLALPIELRLSIYGFVTEDASAMTVGIAELQGSPADIVHRQYGQQRSPFPGIPARHEPVIEMKYQAALLSANAPAIPLTASATTPPERTLEHARNGYRQLSLVCQQVSNELKNHFDVPSRRRTSLFLQYPFGLHIMHQAVPHLLRQSRSVHLAGVYDTDDSRRNALRYAALNGLPPRNPLRGKGVPDSDEQLSHLVKSMFGPEPQHPMEMFEMRIYYPGTDSYSTVWSDDSSPTCIALKNIAFAEVSIEVWRGFHATGVHMKVVPSAEKRRVVSTTWKKFPRGEPDRDSWIVDPNWPDASLESTGSSGTRPHAVFGA